MAKGPVKPPDWHKAAIAGDDATISWLLAGDQSVDRLDGYGQTALMLAALHGHSTTVALLLGHGAALDVTAKYGLSALMLAVVNHRDGVARRLIAAGADLALRGTGAGFYGKTARDLAADSGQVELAADIARAGGP